MKFITSSLFLLLFTLSGFCQVTSFSQDKNSRHADDLPSLEVIESIPETCGEGNGTLKVIGKGGVGPYQYSLDGNSYGPDNIFTNLISGVYAVYVLDQKGNSTSIDAEVKKKADLAIKDLITSPTSCSENTGTVRFTIEGGKSPLFFSIDNHPFQADPEFDQLGLGHYILQAMDATGCVVDTIISIDRTGCSIYIPNIFSPNGDGVNDEFKPETTMDQKVIVKKFYVFDRWGNNVYTAYNLDIHASDIWWDGNYKRFTMNPGIFNYFIEVQYESGDTETFKGNVKLVR